jgi:pheromone shutdown protein TraB
MRPSIVAVELDEERLWALRNPNRDKMESPIHSGLLPWLLALLERSAGSLTDVFPGSEMLQAVNEAERIGARIVMIDKPIASILGEIRNVPWLEKLKVGFDVLGALFSMSTSQKTTQLMIGVDGLMAEFQKKYPTLFQILVKERDQFMADKLQEILDLTTGSVIAVVGLGHVNGIMRHLSMNRETADPNIAGVSYEWTLRVADT